MKDEVKHSFEQLGLPAERITNRLCRAGLAEPEQSRQISELKEEARQGHTQERRHEENVGPRGAARHASHLPIPKLQQRVLEMQFASKAEFRGWGGGKPSSNPKPTAARANPRSQRSRE